MHILLIDDSSSTRSLLRTLINAGQEVRHTISEASSGEEALQKVATGEISQPDLIIVDINMGGMTGYDLCREFRQKHGVSEVQPYIIIVTANEGVEVINEGLEAGANDYMPKPVNVKILHVRLRVAERLLNQAQSGSLGGGGNGRQALVASAIDVTEAPIAIVQAGGADSSFEIIYANAAMVGITQFGDESLLGQPLSEIEAWTPEFLKMTMGFIGRGAVLSHVPLWSKTKQAAPVHLSFYPIIGQDQVIGHYLVIHHL